MREFIFLFFFCGTIESLVLNNAKVKSDKDEGKSSLAFVFDTTGSMSNDLKQLREGAGMILKTALEESNIIADFVFVPFHDPTIGPATITKSKEVFKNALNIVNVMGGGDCPEKSLGGVLLALSVSRPRSYVYVFTDASASDYNLVGKVLDVVQRKQSQVVFVLTGHCNDVKRQTYKVYQQVATASSGQVFNLNKTNVHNVLDFLRSSIQGRSVNLASAVHPAGYNYTQAIPVDSSLGEVTVSVSGAKPTIKVVNPSGQEVVGPPQLVTTLDLSEIMIVKVLQPEPGNWTITVGSEKDYSVKVSGLSNVTFDHGFSVEKTHSMDVASYRPLQGTYNHMLLSMTPEVSIQIDYAEILTTDGKTLFEVPVKQLDKNTFVADAFIPPDDLFYIAINGRDQNGQKFRRVGPTAVQAKPPDVPYLTAPKKIEARSHDRVVLKCNVESLVPVTVQWTRASPTMQRKTSSLQSTSIEYVIEDMSEADVGSYRCSASNAAGHSKINTQLSLLVEPPQVSVLPVNATLSSGEDLTVSCAVFSEAMLLKSQIIFNNGNKVNVTNIKVGRNIDGFYSYNKTISNVTEKHRGTYTCLAVNRGGTTNQSTYIFIESEPTAKILGPDILAGQMNTKLQLLCQVENAKLAQWMSPNGTVAKEVTVNRTSNITMDVTVTEEGYWTCIGLRNSHRASDIVQVNIEIKPEVVIEDRNITIVEGSIQQLVCTARAKPPPSLTWRRGTHDYNTTVVQVNETAYRSVLTLDSDRQIVNGTYSCIAENSLGTAQDSVVVNVRRKMRLMQNFTDQQVELYSQVDLHCNVDTHPPATITWQHNHTDVQTDDNTDISEDGTILYIQKVDFNDLGLYTCRMDNGYENIQINGTLNVVGLESPVLSKEPSRITARRGDTALISCRLLNGNPEPKITWQYKSNGTEEFKHLRNKVELNEDGFVVAIHNVSLQDEGFYQCMAENAIGKDNYQVFLDIQYPPELKYSGPQSVLEIKSGEKVVLNCNAVGNPSPIVVWTKGKPVSYSKNVYLSDTNELVISNVSLYHSGTYSCNASSALGSVTTNYTLEVYMSPTISTQTPKQAIQVLEGQLVELPCAVSGSPTPPVTWLHNDKNVTERRKYIDEYGLRFVANLTDFGDYSCIATNAYGKAVLNYTVYVWVVPFLEPPLLETKNVLLGSNITLQCNAIGFPVPIIMWQFNNSLLAENSTDLSYNEFGQLNISNASNKHEGYYECVAENLAGFAAKTITVNINEPPKILEDNYTGPYVATVLDTSLAVACKAAGKPAPYVVWIKDGYYLDRDSRYDIDVEGTLTIRSPSEDLSGDYTCLAKNAIGTATRTVPVHIYSVPSMMVSEESQSVVHVVEGSNATVDCPLRRGLNDTLKWYKDAELISNKSLHLTPVTRAHAATYACVVSNIAGGAHAALTVDVQWPPHSQTTTQLVETVKGNDVNLNCDVDAKPRAKTRWLFNSKLLLGEDKSHLKLTNIQLRQTGVYKCIAANEHGTVVKEFTVDVLVPPFISDFDVLDVQLKEGTNATLECNARGYPKPHIKWTFNNTSWVINNSTISANITTDSEGIYKCEASNKAGTTSLVYRVNVVKVASIENIVAFNDTVGTNVAQRLEVIHGSYIRIACKGSGKPVPNIQWIRYGNTVSNNTPSISYADLIIHKVATSDSGVYVCVASNEGGVDERKIKLEVLEPPKIFQNLFQEESSTNIINLEVLSGQAFYMHCHPFGNPSPDIYWFKDNIPLKLFDDTMISTDFSEIIQSPNAKYEQTGNYTCIAKNKVGETGLVYLVDVLVPPPQPKESMKEVRTRISKALNLTCPAEGVPKPYVTWIKHPYMEISEHVPRVQLTDDNVTLIINDTLVTDSGLYSCVITNKVGAIEVNFNVIIEKPSSIVGNVGNDTVENHVVSLRRSVVLKCDVDGHPPPKITWLKDMQRLSEGGGGGVQVQAGVGSRLLAVWGAEERHAGQYICMAENSAGIASRRYNLAVKVPGKWSAWSQWSYCNVTCGLGYQKRSRFCHYIDDKNNTIDKTSMSDKIILDESACKGSTIDKRKCHMPSCEEEVSGWSGWSRWGVCSATCGAGTQARARRCRARARNECSGDNVQIRKCPNLPKCSPQSRHPTNEVYSSQESETDMYLPETTIEMQPDDDFKRTLYPEEAYVPTGKKPQIYFDVKVTENLDRSERGPCDAGFRYNATDGTCEDVDECSYDINQCHLTQVCTNTAGGYRCSCPAGYVALAAGLRCLDVNECEQEVHGCEFACVNVAGGYVCACPRHLRLHLDRHHCVLPPLYKKPLSFDENSVSDEYLTDEDVPARYSKYTRY